jgi:hypothetical protein
LVKAARWVFEFMQTCAVNPRMSFQMQVASLHRVRIVRFACTTGVQRETSGLLWLLFGNRCLQFENIRKKIYYIFLYVL